MLPNRENKYINSLAAYDVDVDRDVHVDVDVVVHVGVDVDVDRLRHKKRKIHKRRNLTYQEVTNVCRTCANCDNH